MALPDFDVDNISIDDLISLMLMQWESITAEGRVSARSTLTTPSSGLAPPAFSVHTPPLLTDAERTRLTAAGGCWKCRKTLTDPGWVHHVGRTCPGDAARGITPGHNFVKVKQETTGTAINFDMDGEDQQDYPDNDDYPDPIDAETDFE